MAGKLWNTLRFRLALWNAGVVALTALLVLLGLRQGVRWAILHEMDQILIEDIEEIRLALAERPEVDIDRLTSELRRKAIGHRQHGWFVNLIDASGQILWTSVDPAIQPGPPLVRNAGEPVSVAGFRIVAREIEHLPGGVATVQVGSTLNFLVEEMDRIDRLVLWTSLTLLVAAPLVGYWLAGRAARTMGRIIVAAGELRPDQLADRLPIRGTGDELDQLALTVNGLLDRIARYVTERKDFLANAAHDLRTPLAAIRSSIEVALDRNCSADDYRELLEEIIEQGASLEVLVNQLLLLSESEAEQIRVDDEPVPLGDLLRRAVEMFRGLAESRDLWLSLEIAAEAHVRGNRHLLRQLVNNLLDNAVKYTPAGGRIRVGLATHDDHALVTVSDTGVGLAAEDLPRIFERFFRTDRSRTRAAESPGTGLGLSICRAVAEAHQGAIRCHSEVDRGTTFTVILPLDARR
jgi:two-component system heavy metal sensor histidine kinase CusS